MKNTNQTIVNNKELGKIVPKVFISYSWTSEEHKEWVLKLAQRLVEEMGVDVILDRWHLVVGQDRFIFMENSIFEADKVIVICDKEYCEKAEQRLGGVGVESTIITPDLYEDTEQTKFIPVALVKNNNKYTLPKFFSSRVIHPMTPEDDFEKSFVELGRLIWEEPAEKMPPIGKKPNFDANNSTLFMKADEETVLWMLPRGFLVFTDITFLNSNSWAVTAHHYDYNGKWKHGTHYHDSYRYDWQSNLSIQYHKLEIPLGDRMKAYYALLFLQELRETSMRLDIKALVDEQVSYGCFVEYYKKDEDIILPKIPNKYLELNQSGDLRDVIEKLQAIRVDKLFSPINDIYIIRQEAYNVSKKYFGETHDSMRFISEVIEEFNMNFDIEELNDWCKRLKYTLQLGLYE